MLRRQLLAAVDRVTFSSVRICVCSILIPLQSGSERFRHRWKWTYGAVLAFPNRFGDTINCASHPALSHNASIRCDCTAGHLAVHPRAAAACIHHVIKAAVKREARAKVVFIKEAAPTLTMYIVVAISTARVGIEWVKHGVVHLAEDGLEEPERIGEGGVAGPAKVEGVFGEGYVALPAGIAGAATMTGPS